MKNFLVFFSIILYVIIINEGVKQDNIYLIIGGAVLLGIATANILRIIKKPFFLKLSKRNNNI